MPGSGHDRAGAPLDAAPAVGALLSGRYRLDGVLGRGGMGVVYRATDEVLERTVAVKVVHAAGDPETRRFQSEVRALATLNHPGVVRLYDAGAEAAVPYFVMEYVEGPAFTALLADGPLDPQRVQRAGLELAEALAHAHDHGVVHRDVKPGNVLEARDGRTRLTDFGIARLADATRITQPGMATGTAAYLAPEQVTGQDVGPAADVYALGLVLLEALTGTRAFAGPPAEAANARLHRDPEIPDGLPAPWPQLLAAMTARRPEDRPTAAHVAEALERTADPSAPTAIRPAGAGGATATQALPSRRGSARGRRGVVAVALAALALAASLLAVSLQVEGEPDATAREGPTAEPAPPPEHVPPELDDALQRLEEAVRP